MTETDASITVDGVSYKLSDMSEKALAELGSLRVVDQEIAKLQQQLAIYQTARNAYARALSEQLPKKTN